MGLKFRAFIVRDHVPQVIMQSENGWRIEGPPRDWDDIAQAIKANPDDWSDSHDIRVLAFLAREAKAFAKRCGIKLEWVPNDP